MQTIKTVLSFNATEHDDKINELLRAHWRLHGDMKVVSLSSVGGDKIVYIQQVIKTVLD